MNNHKWAYPKVSIRTFIEDPYYLGIKEETYPKVKEICEKIIEGNYVEGVEVGGIGSGKSFSSEILACYGAHHLLCLSNAHRYYHLAKDKKITIMNMGISATQAHETVFTGIRSFIEKSPFFNQFDPRILEGSIEFKKQKILLFPGNSKSTTPLGYNIFYAILDEAAFYLDNDNKSNAEEIYTALQRRIVSRFGNDGLLIMISSPRYIGDFIMRKLEESKRNSKIYGIQLPTWKIKSLESQDLKGKFYLNTETGVVQDSKPDKKESIDLIADKDFKPVATWWEIPGEYKKSFISNSDKAKRDFGAIPSLTLEAFDRDSQIVDRECNMERESPIDKQGRFKDWFKCDNEETDYYIHIDLGIKKDACGFCMVSPNGVDERDGDEKLKIKIDLMLQIKPPEGGEVRIGDIRQIIYSLEQRGFNIAKVTFDQYQSADSLQILEDKGIEAELLSVDRTIEPYNTLKELLHTGRLDFYDYEPFKKEYQQLELIKGKKVDHPPTGCFSGDTRVALLDGTNPTFEQLVKNKSEEKFYVYTFDGIRIKAGLAHSPRITKIAEVIEVELDNFQVIRCTPDHLFMLYNGTYAEARTLVRGTSLMPLYKSVTLKGGWSEYEQLWQPRLELRELTHKIVAKQFSIVGEIIHHKDENKRNNTPDNLNGNSKAEHARYHSTKRHREDLVWHNKVKKATSDYAKSEKGRLLSSETIKKHMPHIIANRQSRQKNHRVLSVRKTGEVIPVYDLTVEETHNFALSVGVFVHNSKDVSDAVAGACYSCIQVEQEESEPDIFLA